MSTTRLDEIVLGRAPKPGEYEGMSVMTADERARELIASAADSGVWKYLPEHLGVLRRVMLQNGGCP